MKPVAYVKHKHMNNVKISSVSVHTPPACLVSFRK